MENFDLFNSLKNEMMLTTEDDKVWIQPSEAGFTTYPLPEDRKGCILVSKDEYVGLLLCLLTFSEDLKSVVPIL